MQNRHIKRLIYLFKHQYLTLNNVVLAVAVVVGLSWAYSSVQAIQRNYQLQREVANKQRQTTLLKLEGDNLEFEQHYYQSSEYLALEAKRRLGLAEQGEKLLILPPNTKAIIDSDTAEADRSSRVASAQQASTPSNYDQWLEFLFGPRGRGVAK